MRHVNPQPTLSRQPVPVATRSKV